ncbi:MAG: GNAT family N-acetyltransferase [Caldilineaceae bacterium]
MILTTYPDVGAFLDTTQATLEKAEVVNGLMLGLCLRLRQFPEYIDTPPYLAAVHEVGQLMAAAIMTPPFNLIVQSDSPMPGPALELIVRDLIARNHQLPGVLGPAAIAQTFAELYSQAVGLPYRLGVRERVFALHQINHPTYPIGRLRWATLDDLAQVAQWMGEFNEEALGENRSPRERVVAERRIEHSEVYFWDTGIPVSMAAKSRPTRHGITVNLVYTPPSLRGRGYASACVAALSQQLLDEGWQFCTLFTDLANPTSNSIYQKIGYQPVCDFNLYRFTTTAEDRK